MDLSTSSILIVEDQKENIDLIRGILGDSYRLRIATKGSDALRSIALERPDLVLMDVGLPDIDGFEVCARMLENEGNASIPVIFLTAATTQQDEMTGLKLGAVDYIYKPYNPSIIKNRVKNQLELSRYRWELEDLVHKRTQELKEAQIGLLTTFELATGYRHKETGDHVIRTKKLVTLLTDLVAPLFPNELNAELAELVVETSSLHDIGKISIPDTILLKPGPLTREEYLLMQSHPMIGRDMLLEVLTKFPKNKFLQVALQIAAYHHEHWDGTGYPYGLKGEAIPLPARLMGVVDVYDAMTSDRVYRKGMEHSEVIRIFREGDGRTLPSHFDPTILAVFLAHEQVFAEVVAVPG
ncbi:MAG: response regulator [Spirochaetia bacterium]|nr:response regulator [Spirochaetia bacterium]